MLTKAARTVAIMAAAIMASCGSTMVHAQDKTQSETNERLRACDALTGMTEKLACFGAVVENLDQSPAAPVAGPASATTATADVTVAETAPAAAPATGTAAPGPEPAAVDSSSPATDDRGGPAATPSAHAASAVATVTVITPTPTAAATNSAAPGTVNTAEPVTGMAKAEQNFGLESVTAKAAPKEVEKKEEETASIRATIVSAWATVDGRFEARLDNGQVWRETQRTRRMRLPREGSPVVISKGRLGGYKMKIGNDNRISAVRRTQ